MFGQCALRTTLSKLTSELRWLFTFSQPFLGPFFLFLPNLSRPPYPSCVNGLVFSHPGLPLPLDSSTTASHGSNRAVLLPRPQNRKQGRTRAFPFSAHSLPTFPLRGKAGLFSNQGCLGLLDALTTAPHGSNRAGKRLNFCVGVALLFWVSKRLGLLSVFA